MKYDYLVVGSGLYGAIFAHEAKAKGKSVLVVDKRPNIAGNIYTENVEGINVHVYGAHIFHTNNTKVWKYIRIDCIKLFAAVLVLILHGIEPGGVHSSTSIY